MIAVPAPSEAAVAYAAEAWLEEQFRRQPSMSYQPGREVSIEGQPIDEVDNGQLQFHKAPHIFRFLAPGNGWGKTATVSVEVDWWVQGTHPWPHEIPLHRPRRVVWICQKYQQWEMIREDIERWWTPGWRFVQSPKWAYIWPDGSRVFIITAETDWRTVQGIQPDLVAVDEECPAPLFREMVKRRRGAVRTRFIMSATATQGLNWPYHDYYLPWRKFHEARGIHDEREMMRRQLHRFEDPALAHLPGVWIWPQGSHKDNPTATAETWAFYLANTHGNKAERQVRLFGGYRSFAGQPVFDLDNLEKLRAHLVDGSTGQLVLTTEAA